MNVNLHDMTLLMDGVTVNVTSVTRQITKQPFAVTAVSAKEFYNSTSDAKEVLNRVPGIRV